MSFIAVMYHHQNQLWEENHKVSFHGKENLIYVHPDVTTLDVKVDLYSDIKELYNHGNTNRTGHDWSKYPIPIRTVAGDPTVSGGFLGDAYFMTNGCRLVIDLSKTKLTGILFSDDYDTPLLDANTLAPIYSHVVSNLALRPGIDGTGLDKSVWEYVPASTVTGSYGEKIDQIEINSSTAAGGAGLTVDQAAQLADIFTILGLDPTKPLITTPNSMKAGASIVQTITGDANTSITVTRTV